MIPWEPELEVEKFGDIWHSGPIIGVVTSVSESEPLELEEDISLAEELTRWREGWRRGVVRGVVHVIRGRLGRRTVMVVRTAIILALAQMLG